MTLEALYQVCLERSRMERRWAHPLPATEPSSWEFPLPVAYRAATTLVCEFDSFVLHGHVQEPASLSPLFRGTLHLTLPKERTLLFGLDREAYKLVMHDEIQQAKHRYVNSLQGSAQKLANNYVDPLAEHPAAEAYRYWLRRTLVAFINEAFAFTDGWFYRDRTYEAHMRRCLTEPFILEAWENLAGLVRTLVDSAQKRS